MFVLRMKQSYIIKDWKASIFQGERIVLFCIRIQTELFETRPISRIVFYSTNEQLTTISPASKYDR